jgi:glyoxylase-like metal-dependent hydrolase (beta-lactamase superfamily II)
LYVSSNSLVDVPAKVSPETVAERQDEMFVLDVRNEDDYEEWSIAQSHNVPIYDELLDEEFSELADATDDLPSDEELAVVCVAGITSARAAQFLRDRGYEARTMTDGMEGWGTVHRRFDVDGAAGVTQVVRPGTGCVSYLVHDRGEAVAVDPSLYTDEYVGLADDLDVELVGAIDTHAHADHVSGAPLLSDRLDVPYYLHEADSGDLSEYTPLSDGETVSVGTRDLEVLHTPGHTPGSVSLHSDGALLSGDTLFVRSVGRPDLEGDDEEAARDAARDLHESVQRLRGLPDDTLVLPGHASDEGVRPLATTLYGLERNNDPVAVDDEREFVDAIVGSLGSTPSNYEEIKAMNWGEEPLTEEAEELELGPNNCAAN